MTVCYACWKASSQERLLGARWGGGWLQVNTAPKLVLLDVGMVAELTPEDQQNLVGFFKVGCCCQ